MQDALIAIVQRTDIDPDRLEKFMDLQFKMEDRQNEQAYNSAMAGFQAECPIIKKSGKVKFTSASGKETKYDFAPLDEIISIIKPILPKFGLSYSFDVKTVDANKSKIITSIRHKNGFCKDTDYEFDTIHDDQRMNLSQRRKSAVSFAKRAAIENALGIVTANEDDDARRAIDNNISKDQLEEIERLLTQTGVTKSAFLAYLKSEKFEELSEYDAKKAILALKQRKSSCIK
jgi:hypothetical protein